MSDLSYIFTKYGEVITGEKVLLNNFPEHRVIIQRNKINDYNKLAADEKTKENIEKFGYVIPKRNIEFEKIIPKAESDVYFVQKKNNRWFEFDRSVMFIIGAGASANCVSKNQHGEFKNDPLRPPLGTQLFDKRFNQIYSKYPGVRYSLPSINRADNDVEEFLENEWHEILNYANEEVMSRHINIQFYLQELLQKVGLNTLRSYEDQNLFAILADRLAKLHNRQNKKKYAFVSFNQDSILEYFLKRYFTFELKTLDDYIKINEGPFSIFKPHGSWNWGWELPMQGNGRLSAPDYLFEHKVNYGKLYYELLGDYHTMVDWNSYGINHGSNVYNLGKLNVNKSRLSIIHEWNENMYFPALLLPYRDKDEFTMPSEHYWDLHNYLGYVEILIIIGWKGNEAHFNRLLRSECHRIKKLIIVDPEPEKVTEHLAFIIDKKAELKLYDGFDDFIEYGLDIEFPLTI